jgi:predicted alpha-1,2-mannosidase
MRTLILVGILGLVAGCGGTGGGNGGLDLAIAHDLGGPPDDLTVAAPADLAVAASDDLGPAAPADLAAPPDLAAPVTRYTDLVDPFIGTSGGKNLNCFPGAILPWGMVAASPDTTPSAGSPGTGNHAAGYLSEDDLIQGFSHTRLQGTSTPDIGVVMLMPAVGTVESLITNGGVRSPYVKASETAAPGYYAVTLSRPNVRAEMAATRRGAHHRYTFLGAPADGNARVVLDLAHAMLSTSIKEAQLTVNGDTLEGYTTPSGRFSGPSAGGLKTYFSIQFDPAPSSVSTWSGSSVDGSTTRSGTNIGAVATFANTGANGQVRARVGISYVDVAGARKNRLAELPGTDFDATRRRASDAWQEQLQSVRFEGGSAAQRTIMATALYHSFIVPSLVTDVDGRYHGYDNANHTANFDYHANFSMWDTYRTVHPLLSLVRRDQQRNLSRSLIQMAREGGYYPRWAMGHGYPNITAGSPADIVVAESYLKGVDGFDASEALDLMLKEVDHPPPAGHPHSGREGLADYLSKGYIPFGLVVPGVGSRVIVRSLEYNVADAAIANLATRLGRSADATRAGGWAQSYKTVWDPSTNVFRARNADGSWVSPFDQYNGDEAVYYGANALQYSWLVPQDMLGLRALHGSPANLVAHLTTFFEQAEAAIVNGTAQKWYTHGNEPDIHSMYLFLAGGRPDLAQKWIDWASNRFYSTARDGLPGNEDAGALSAWYVLSSIGIYPVSATSVWLLGRPAFAHITLTVGDKQVIVDAPGAGAGKIYVTGVTWNGVPLAHPWMQHADLAKGGTLKFEMSDQPAQWGADFGSF